MSSSRLTCSVSRPLRSDIPSSVLNSSHPSHNPLSQHRPHACVQYSRPSLLRTGVMYLTNTSAMSPHPVSTLVGAASRRGCCAALRALVGYRAIKGPLNQLDRVFWAG